MLDCQFRKVKCGKCAVFHISLCCLHKNFITLHYENEEDVVLLHWGTYTTQTLNII